MTPKEEKELTERMIEAGKYLREKKKKRVYTVEAFLKRDLSKWMRTVIRPRASRLKEFSAERRPLDKHVDRQVYDKHVHPYKVKPVDRRVRHWVRTPIIRKREIS